MKKLLFPLLTVLLITSAGCKATAETPAVIEEPVVVQEPTLEPTTEPTLEPTTPIIPEMILATTTSTQDSGLLDVLVPLFEEQTGYIVQVVAVGTGAALQMGQEGNADVLLVHAPSSEVTFMNDGYGSERYLVMHNDFILVGPAEDPAGVKTAATAIDAFALIASTGSPFVSRGDDSGTHKAEKTLWTKANVTEKGAWYIETGQGMGATLTIASEQQSYTYTDRATYLANKDTYNLEILYEGDSAMLNVYHVIVVNHDKWPATNLEGAQAFAQFMIAPETQAVIGEFGVDKYGAPLFFPDADKTDADLGL